MKSKDEKKVTLWQDTPEINRATVAYKGVADRLSLVMDELKAIGIEPGQPILQDLFASGELIKKKLNRILEKEIAGYVLPSRKDDERLKFKKVLETVDRIVIKVGKEILQRDRPHTTYIDTTLLTWIPGGVTFDEQSITDSNSVYLENDGQRRILNLAKQLIAKMEEFNREVIEASMSQVRGIGRPDDKDWNLIEIYSDYTFDIDYQAFKKIS